VKDVEPGPLWEPAAEASQRYEAELMALRLRAAGIPAAIVDQSFRQEPLPNVRSFAIVRVLVPSEHVERARRLLAEHAGLPEEAEPQPTEPET
jgi:hypothetical protein